MSDKRKLAFATGDKFFDKYATGWIVDPTDAEVADLLARVLEAAGHELPDLDYEPVATVEYRWEIALKYLALLRAALARDAEKAEREQAVKRLAEDLGAAYVKNQKYRSQTFGGALHDVASRAYELGARA